MSGTVLTIGNFDGVHAGHAELIRRARGVADAANARVVVLSFDPHPRTILDPGPPPPRLTTFERRTELLLALGADEVVRLDPVSGILDTEPEDFITGLVGLYEPVAFVEGHDFHFGRDRTGRLDTLVRLGERLGFRTEIVEPVEVCLDDHTVVRASSSMIRWLVARSRVRDAGRVLGRPYELGGPVIRGQRRGRTIGFPTANVQPECLEPGDGVYAAVAQLPDSRRFVAAVNVGPRPTFADDHRQVEAHLLDVPTGGGLIDGYAEYGWTIRLELLSWIREPMAFESAAALTAQLKRDCDRARMIAEARDRTLEIGACP